MQWRLLFVCLLAPFTHAFSPAPIRWSGLPAKSFVLAPKNFQVRQVPNRAPVLPQVLAIWEQPVTIPLSEIPHFTQESDNTLSWSGLCLESSGDHNGDVARLNHCTGGTNQLWSLLPSGNQGGHQFQLRGSNKCLDIAIDDNDRQTNLDGALVALQECIYKATESWIFEEPTSLQMPASSHSNSKFRFMRQVTVHIMISIPALGVLSLGAWLWLWRSKPSVSAIRREMEPAFLDHGEICLVPAVLALKPTKKPKPTEPSDASTMVSQSTKGLGRRKSNKAMRNLESSVAAERVPSAGKRKKRNKYAQYSKAEQRGRSSGMPEEFFEVGAVGEPSTEMSTSKDRIAPAVRERNKWVYPHPDEIDPYEPATWGFLEVGTVIGAHGTSGELRVSSDSHFAAERLCVAGTLWMRRPRRRFPRSVELLGGRKGPGSEIFLIRLAGVSNREEAAALRGACLHMRREIQPQLEEEELMVWQLEGLDVATIETRDSTSTEAEAAVHEWCEIVGRVVGVISREELTGNPDLGNDLLEVELSKSGSALEEGESVGDDEGDIVFVPYVEQIVVQVNLEARVLIIDPPGGLLELIQPKPKSKVVIRGILPLRAESLISTAAHASDGLKC